MRLRGCSWVFLLALCLSVSLGTSWAGEPETTPNETPEWTLSSSVESLSWSELTSASVLISRQLAIEAERLQQTVHDMSQRLDDFETSYSLLEARSQRYFESALNWRLEVAALSSSLDATTTSYERSIVEQAGTIASLRTEVQTVRQQRDAEARASVRWKIIGVAGLIAGLIGLGLAALA